MLVPVRPVYSVKVHEQRTTVLMLDFPFQTQFAIATAAALQAIKLFGLEVPCQLSGSPFWPRENAPGLLGLLPHCRRSTQKRHCRLNFDAPLRHFADIL